MASHSSQTRWLTALSYWAIGLIMTGIVSFLVYQRAVLLNNRIENLESLNLKFDRQIRRTNEELNALKSQDQYKVNSLLKEKIANIEKTYRSAVVIYEQLLDLKTVTKKTEELDERLAKSLTLLSKENFASAEAELKALGLKIVDEKQKALASFQIPANVPSNNSAPASGYQRQLVTSDVGEFMVDVIAADLNSTRVIVDTASDSTCKNDCPVLSLGDYVSRNGAFAGINGSYFCPSTYPTCSDKKNSFDTLLMNKNKTYFNSENNTYSSVPAVIFGGNWARFVGQSLEWGRDTGVDAVLANQPLLVSGGNVVFNGDGEPKRGAKGTRGFVGASGNMVYIGVVYNATTAEGAHVIKTMGIQNALNLDSGGSTALWSGGYRVGPGRNIPNALLFVHK